MQRADQEHRKYLKGLVDGSPMVWTMVARETRVLPEQAIEVEVRAGWLGVSSVRTKARFVPLDQFSPKDVRYVDMKTPLPYGKLRIRAPFGVTVFYLEKDKFNGFQRSFADPHGEEILCDLPVGEYRVGSSMMLLSSKRSKVVRVEAGKTNHVELTSNPPFCKLHVSVKDAAGRPTTAFSLGILKKKALHSSQHQRGGRSRDRPTL